MKKLKVLISVIAMSFIVGCGGGGSSSDDGINTVDNSVLADGETYLGYYGANVVFGNHTVARQWDMTTPSQPGDVISLLLPSDSSEGLKLEDGQLDVVDFGVSQDGKSMLLLEEGLSEVVGIYLTSVTSSSCYSGYLKNLSTNDTLDISICAN